MQNIVKTDEGEHDKKPVITCKTVKCLNQGVIL